MKSIPVAIVVILAAISASAQSPAIHGHVLGESFKEFVSQLSPESQANFATCLQMSINGCNEDAPASSTYGSLSISAMLEHYSDEDVHVECEDLTGNSACKDYDAKFYFAHGQLVEMIFTAFRTTWSGILTSSIGKFGKPGKQGTSILQNGFGATTTERYASWGRSSYVASVSEFKESVGDDPAYVIHVTDRETWKFHLDAHHQDQSNLN